MGLPYTGGHAGQLLFGPADACLYLITGDCSRRGDSSNFAQNKKSLLGKILRVDIDNIMPGKYREYIIFISTSFLFWFQNPVQMSFLL